MTVIKIDGEIGWDITDNELSNELKQASGDIEILINSVGGSIYQGIAMFNAIRAYNKGSITTVNMGMAASMGSYLLLAGDTIKAHSNSTYMVHNALTYGYAGNHHDLRATADKLEKLSEMLAGMYVAKTGKSLEEIKKMMDDTTYLYGDEMLKEGFVDEIISDTKHLGKDKAILALDKEIMACTRSSKEHCAKHDAYNATIDDILAAMPSAKEKIANQNHKGVDMSITQEEFDALNSEKEALAASLKDANDRIMALEENIPSKNEQDEDNTEHEEAALDDRVVVMSYCAANRNIISHAREADFISANASLADVMEYTLKEAASDPFETDREQGVSDADAEYLKQAIAKINGGK